jgi:hypothetical protein
MSKDNMTMSTPNDDLHRANCVAYKMVVEHSSRFLVASQFQEALSYLIQASCVCTRCMLFGQEVPVNGNAKSSFTGNAGAYSHFSAYPYFGTFLALLIELPNPHDRQLIVRLLLEICAGTHSFIRLGLMPDLTSLLCLNWYHIQPSRGIQTSSQESWRSNCDEQWKEGVMVLLCFVGRQKPAS